MMARLTLKRYIEVKSIKVNINKRIVNYNIGSVRDTCK